MNTSSYACRHKPAGFVDDQLTEIGDFCWELEGGQVSGLYINAPETGGGSRGVVFVPVRPGPNAAGRYWGWDGNLERPTLTPSIHWIGHWHGYLKAGRLESV